MTSEMRRSVCLIVGCLLSAISYPPGTATALDTANMLMGIDGMVILHSGLFRTGTPNDGVNTFSFGTFQTGAGSLGRYHSFLLLETGDGDCCISHRDRLESWTPTTFIDTEYVTAAPLDVTSDHFPVIDRAVFGQRFDPEDYEVEVQFKPNFGVAGIPDNASNSLSVGFDQHFGFIFDAEENIYKRSTETIGYVFGNEETPINDWYNDPNTVKDADGFATWSVPVLDYSGSGRSSYYNYGDGPFRDANVVPGGGRVFNEETMAWEDANVGYNGFSQFGGGGEDPSRPGSKLNTPNGISLLYFGAPAGNTNPLSIEVKSVAVKRINPGPIAARIDEDSGLSYRFGSGFTRGPNFAPININGIDFLPEATDQISRFDENGMTNLIFNMREPDDPNEVHRFFTRYPPGPNTFDGTDAVVNVRARLTEPLGEGIAQTLQINAKDLDGNDMAESEGGDEYTYDLDLNQFNTETFTTVSIPLSEFTLSEHVPTIPPDAGSGPFGFANAGDGLISDFNLYEFGGLLASNSGVLRLELDYLEIRLPETGGGLPGDYNEDGVVNAADYVAWRNLNGTAADLPNRDPNLSGDIGEGDYTFWAGHFGDSNGAGSGLAGQSAVPEPSCLLLVTALLVGLSATFSRSARQ